VQGFVLTVVGQNSLPISIAIRSLRQNSSSCSRRLARASTLPSSKTGLVRMVASSNDKCRSRDNGSFEPELAEESFVI
jgi:hypothetical protein